MTQLNITTVRYGPKGETYHLQDATFDESTHRYRWKDRLVPGVTKVLVDGGWRHKIPDGVGGGPNGIVAKAMDRGRKVHSYAEERDAGRDGYEFMSVETMDFISADEKLRDAAEYEPIVSEIFLVHPVLLYGGRIDVVAWFRVMRVLADRKTGAIDPSVWLQLAAYKILWEFWFPQKAIDYTATMHYRKDATPRFVRNPYEVNAAHVWAGALWRHWWMTQPGVRL